MNHARSPEIILKEIQTWEGIISTLQNKIQQNPDKPHRMNLIKEHQSRILELHKELHEARKARNSSPTPHHDNHHTHQHHTHQHHTHQPHSHQPHSHQPHSHQPHTHQHQDRRHHTHSHQTHSPSLAASPTPPPEPPLHTHPPQNQDNWEDKNFVEKWDKYHLEGNPIRHEQLEILIAVLKGVYQKGTSILDFGMGSGLVEQRIFRTIPEANIVGLDNSEEMLKIARERLSSNPNCEFVKTDITKMKVFQIPPKEYSAVISVQTFHNLPHDSKRRMFSLIYQLLNTQGIFLLMDRIAIPHQELYQYYQLLWKRQEECYETTIREGDCFHEHQKRLQARGEYPLTLKQLLSELNQTGFQATCLHLHGNRALIAAYRGHD